jgi:hypothetical protein
VFTEAFGAFGAVDATSTNQRKCLPRQTGSPIGPRKNRGGWLSTLSSSKRGNPSTRLAEGGSQALHPFFPFPFCFLLQLRGLQMCVRHTVRTHLKVDLGFQMCVQRDQNTHLKAISRQEYINHPFFTHYCLLVLALWMCLVST